MGSLILPASGPVYADAQIVIYSMEKHPIYAPTLRPLWEAVARGDLEVLSSELTLMETLIGPLKQGNITLETDYENFFVSPGIRLLPITSSILRAGARLRATLNGLRTPDAIQAATGHSCSCTLFLTNDLIFRRIPSLPVALLDDVLAP
jgi:predicted nucleic acid-binding protein